MNLKKAMIPSFLVVILSFVFADLALAAIYKTVDKDGNVIFTNTRPIDEPSEEVQLRPVTTMSPVRIRRSGSSVPDVKNENDNKAIYSRLEIVEPANDSTVRGQDSFKVKIATEPEVLSDHTVRLLLDGNVVGESKRKLSFELMNTDRGTHTLTVEIVNNQRKVIQSSSSRVHVHRNIYRPDVSINPPE